MLPFPCLRHGRKQAEIPHGLGAKIILKSVLGTKRKIVFITERKFLFIVVEGRWNLVVMETRKLCSLSWKKNLHFCTEGWHTLQEI